MLVLPVFRMQLKSHKMESSSSIYHDSAPNGALGHRIELQLHLSLLPDLQVDQNDPIWSMRQFER